MTGEHWLIVLLGIGVWVCPWLVRRQMRIKIALARMVALADASHAIAHARWERYPHDHKEALRATGRVLHDLFLASDHRVDWSRPPAAARSRVTAAFEWDAETQRGSKERV